MQCQPRRNFGTWNSSIRSLFNISIIEISINISFFITIASQRPPDGNGRSGLRSYLVLAPCSSTASSWRTLGKNTAGPSLNSYWKILIVLCSFGLITVSVGPGLGDPLWEVADEVEEELVLRDAEDLVSHLHKQAEALVMIKYLEAITI